MSDMIKYKEIQNVLIQENGIIRNSKGRIIARLVSDVDFNSEHINDKDNISDCMKVLSKAINKEDDYAYSWHANIAMSCVDAMVETKEKVPLDSYSDYHRAGNEAASRFMKICFDADTSLNMLLDKDS